MPTILAAGAIAPSDITVFLLSVGILLGLAKLLGEVARWLKQPAVLGEIAAGVILGPTLFGSIFPGVYTWLFPQWADQAETQMHVVTIGLDMLVALSVVLLLLTAGLEVDLASVFRQGKATLWVSFASVLIPFVLGFAIAYAIPGFFGHTDPAKTLPFALFIGIALSISALPVIARILMDLNMAKSDTGAMILSSAMINDFIGWIGFALVLAMMQIGGENGATHIVNAIEPLVASLTASGEEADAVRAASETPALTVATTVVLVLLFAGGMLTLGRWVVHRVLPWVQANLSWPGGVLVVVIASALICAAATEWIGIHAIFGAFILGVVMGDSRHLTVRTREMIHQFVTNIFAPLFFATVALRLNFLEAFRWDLVLLVLIVAIIGKVAGCYVGGWLGGLPRRERMVLGSALVARGAMEVILGQLAYSFGLISEELLVAIIIMALATSMISGPMIQWLIKQDTPRSLSKMLSGENFIPRLRATTRQDAIAELAAAAAKVSNLDAREIYESAWRRERRYSTGLRNGIAVPHARCEELKESAIAVGLSETGIDFNSMDGEPSRIICLLITPDPSAGEQITLLDMVARAFASPEARRAARLASNVTEFRAALSVTAGEKDEHPKPEDDLTPDTPNPAAKPTESGNPATAGPKGTLPG